MPLYKIIIDTDANADREAGLQKAVADYNDTLQAPSQPPALPGEDPLPPLPPPDPLTNEQYLQRQLDIAVDSYAKSALQVQTNIIAVKFEKADPTKRQEVLDSLAAIDAGVGAGGGLEAVVNIKPIE